MVPDAPILVTAEVVNVESVPEPPRGLEIGSPASLTVSRRPTRQEGARILTVEDLPVPLQSPEPGSRLAAAAAAPPDGTELAVLGGDQPVVVIAGRAPAGNGSEEGAAFAETSI